MSSLSKPISIFLLAIVTLFIATGSLVFATQGGSKNHMLRQFYESKRAAGHIDPFGDAVFKSLLGTPKAGSTPSKYGVYKAFSPLSSSTNQCASPTTYGNSFGLNICYNYYDYQTNQTFSNIFKYNSTFGNSYQYNSSDCTGSYMKYAIPLNTCDPQSGYVVKLLPATSSPVVSTKPGATFTVYGSQANCQSNNGNGIQGMTWQSTTTNNCFTYDTLVNMGNSSSWSCVSKSFTYLQYNETSNCFGQISYGITYTISQASCQYNNEGDFATGWMLLGCNA